MALFNSFIRFTHSNHLSRSVQWVSSVSIAKLLLLNLFILLAGCDIAEEEVDTSPNSFSFIQQDNVARATWVESESIILSGINQAVEISAFNGEYSINGADFTQQVGQIRNGQSLTVRIMAPAGYGESAQAEFTISDLVVSFAISTSASAPVLTQLDLLDGSEIQAESPMYADSSCEYCDASATQYQWKLEGLEAIQSNEESYLVPTEHLDKVITLTATPINSAGEAGESLSRHYAINGVKQIITGKDFQQSAFSALKTDGSVVTWGSLNDTRRIKDQLRDMVEITSTYNNYAGLTKSGDVINWGSHFDQLSKFPLNATNIVATTSEVAALRIDGTVRSWVQHNLTDTSPVGLTQAKAIFANGSAFAALREDDSVFTWGMEAHGGDSSSVQDQLINVQTIYATASAFAALKKDGSVVTWGDSNWGGDSSSVQAQLTDIKTIFTTSGAFYAMKQDGSIIAWGRHKLDDPRVELEDLNNMKFITSYSSYGAFAAIKADGSVISWGADDYGADSSAVIDQLQNVKTIAATRYGFAAVTHSGSVVAWGGEEQLKQMALVAEDLVGVIDIVGNYSAFAAIKRDGNIITWGDAHDYDYYGGNSEILKMPALTQVQTIANTDRAFSAIKLDASSTTSVISWGAQNWGGNNKQINYLLANSQSIVGTDRAFAALKSDGTVATWGDDLYGADSSQRSLTDVQSIKATDRAFAALKTNGSVLSWGDENYGADSWGLGLDRDIISITANEAAFAAIKSTEQGNRVISWGNPAKGGDSSEVSASLTNITSITGAGGAFFALQEQGQAIIWGDSKLEANSPIRTELNDFKQVIASGEAFAAIKADNTVVAWGTGDKADASAVQDDLINVRTLVALKGLFAAIKQDGTVVFWGDIDALDRVKAIQNQLVNIESIVATQNQYGIGASAALTTEGNVIAWGDEFWGGDTAKATDELVNVVEIFANDGAFVALKNDGNIVVWGAQLWGGYLSQELIPQTIRLEDSH